MEKSKTNIIIFRSLVKNSKSRRAIAPIVLLYSISSYTHIYANNKWTNLISVYIYISIYICTRSPTVCIIPYLIFQLIVQYASDNLILHTKLVNIQFNKWVRFMIETWFSFHDFCFELGSNSNKIFWIIL